MADSLVKFVFIFSTILIALSLLTTPSNSASTALLKPKQQSTKQQWGEVAGYADQLAGKVNNAEQYFQ